MKNIYIALLGIFSALLLSTPPASAHEQGVCIGGWHHDHPAHLDWQHQDYTACLNHAHFDWDHGAYTLCHQNSDGDRIPNCADHCPETLPWADVNFLGCPVDTDRDGVFDYRDDCQYTPLGTTVDARGCRLDTDRDGVVDEKDTCADTRPGDLVDHAGCVVKAIQVVLFKTGSAVLSREATRSLDLLAEVMKKDIGMLVEIQGHADWQGTRDANANLGRDRAKAVKAYLTGKRHGIRSDRFVGTTFSDSRPRYYNADKGGHPGNRRVEVLAIRNLSDEGGPTARETDSIR